MSVPNVFTFVPNVRRFTPTDAFVARVGGEIRTPRQLFELLYQNLQLPGYFGFNWNALFDCLRDFHWVSEKKVVIVHDDLPELEPAEIRIYLDVLHDAVIDWKPDEAHSLQVVFDERVRAHIESVMTKIAD
ncbi:barstar family protein [Ralstonia sp. CHL-2022]|uniref:Barstar family protein n=1 Tax=Ralstonia mojiangensis TaxID=2953895 RepID=A0AAE3I0F2_9RALS|nr:barstar family protein [Ralstonia mojiangensis]MCT7315256.1 barstar family protein [Ralstonia mojiangensis]